MAEASQGELNMKKILISIALLSGLAFSGAYAQTQEPTPANSAPEETTPTDSNLEEPTPEELTQDECYTPEPGVYPGKDCSFYGHPLQNNRETAFNTLPSDASEASGWLSFNDGQESIDNGSGTDGTDGYGLTISSDESGGLSEVGTDGLNKYEGSSVVQFGDSSAREELDESTALVGQSKEKIEFLSPEYFASQEYKNAYRLYEAQFTRFMCKSRHPEDKNCMLNDIGYIPTREEEKLMKQQITVPNPDEVDVLNWFF
jgi:hypothetical protein